MKKNLEQIRAEVAYNWKDRIGTGNEGGRAVAKKVPAQIIQNGFLGALAFAIENAGSAYGNVFESVMAALWATGTNCGIKMDDSFANPGGSKAEAEAQMKKLQGFLDALCKKNADELRTITAESLAYLNYLRRFAKPDKKEPKKGEGK